MFKKFAIVCALAALTVGFAPVQDASAAPPEQVDVPDYINLFLDIDEGTSNWINITAVDFCTWAFGGFNGPPPVIDDSVAATVKPAGQDGEVTRGSIKASDLYIEVWHLDNPEGPYVGPCEDIQQQLFAGGEPWATGTTSLNARTNNLFESDARAISGNTSGTASLTTTDGGEAYRYHFATHFGDRCTDFNCAVTNTSLRAL